MANRLQWEDREDVAVLPAFVIGTLARYEDGVRTEAVAEYKQSKHGLTVEELQAARDFAEGARAELVSLLDFLIGRIDTALD